MAGPGSFQKLYRRVGRSSRIAGLGFIILTIFFLLLSIYRDYVIFEIDSVVCFFAGVILLFRNPHATVQTPVLDAIMLSSTKTFDELSKPTASAFRYVPAGKSVGDVVAVSELNGNPHLPDGTQAQNHSMTITPPGRALAALFMREAGLTKLTLENLSDSLPSVLSENFGLARAVYVEVGEDTVRVVLRSPHTRCGCDEDHLPSASKGGRLGCTVASTLAVLFSQATAREVYLEGCVRSPSEDTWTVSMALGPQSAVAP